jgi:hypothetical protein
MLKRLAGSATTACPIGSNAFCKKGVSCRVRAMLSRRRQHVGTPGRRRVDVAIAKSFSLPREMRPRLRAEAFNVFNCWLYNDPVLNVTAPNFGRIQSVASTRMGQIGLRLTF